MRTFLTACSLLLVAIASANAQTLPGDPVAGRALALRSCAGCHLVAPQQSRPTADGVPSLAAVAQMQTTTELSLRAFLQTPHPTMPDLVLARSEMDHLVSYILSLRAP